MNTSLSTDPFMSAKEIANMFNVSPKTVYHWTYIGIIPHYVLGKSKRFRRAEIEQWVKERHSTQELRNEPHLG